VTARFRKALASARAFFWCARHGAERRDWRVDIPAVLDPLIQQAMHQVL
jgi:hypothetical protein